MDDYFTNKKDYTHLESITQLINSGIYDDYAKRSNTEFFVDPNKLYEFLTKKMQNLSRINEFELTQNANKCIDLIKKYRYSNLSINNPNQANLVCNWSDINFLIPLFLEKLPKIQATKLFKQFEINDIYPYYKDGIHSGYQPLAILLKIHAVPENFKKLAIEKMHNAILEEQANVKTPRESYENALDCYCNILEDEGLCITDDLYTEEIKFILAFPPKDKPVLKQGLTGQVMERINNKEVKHEFVKRQLLATNTAGIKSFYVRDKEEASLANKIIQEFPDDTELSDFLKTELKQYKQ